VGEEKLSKLITLCVLRGLNFGIEGLSGSGKTILADALIELLPDNSVYSLQLSSPTAAFYDAQEINKKRFIYVPELQKAVQSLEVVEFLKGIGEKKTVERKVTNVARNCVVTYRIHGERLVTFYTLALENTYKTDTEFTRRFFHFFTNSTVNQNRNVLKWKAKQRMEKGIEVEKEWTVPLLRHHIGRLLQQSYDFVNPCAGSVVKFCPVKNMKTRSYVDFLFDLQEASALFHSRHRCKMENFLFVTPEDVKIMFDLYWKDFKASLYNIPFYGETVFNIFKEATEIDKALNAQQIAMALKENGFSVSKSVVDQSLKSLEEQGFLETEKDGNKTYYTVADVVDETEQVDWRTIKEEAIANVNKMYPKMVDKYEESCKENVNELK
jgi:DNA-binding transcriptional ArsR family regulator